MLSTTEFDIRAWLSISINHLGAESIISLWLIKINSSTNWKLISGAKCKPVTSLSLAQAFLEFSLAEKRRDALIGRPGWCVEANERGVVIAPPSHRLSSVHRLLTFLYFLAAREHILTIVYANFMILSS